MANLQVKDIDSALYLSLKNRAKKERRSVSQEVVKIIESYLNQPDKKHKNVTEEFLKLSGSWDDDKTSEEIIEDIYKKRTLNSRFEDGIFD